MTGQYDDDGFHDGAASCIMDSLIIDRALSLCKGTDFDTVVLPAGTLCRVPEDGERPVKFRESVLVPEGKVLLINACILGRELQPFTPPSTTENSEP